MAAARITRHDVDRWLGGIADRLASIRNGPHGEMVARVGLLEKHVRALRDRLGLTR